MSALGAWRAAVIAQLTPLGLRVVADPRAVNPPCVLVGVPATVDLGANQCTVAAVLPVYVVAPAPAQGAGAAWLVDHVVPVMRAVNGRTARAVDLSVADGAPPQPAYQINLSATIPDD